MILHIPPLALFLSLLLTIMINISIGPSKALKLAEEEDFCKIRLSKLVLGLAHHFDPGFLIHIVLPDNNTICLCTCYNDLVEKDFFYMWQIIVTQHNSHELIRDGLESLPDLFILVINNYGGLLQLSAIFSELNKYTKSWNPSAKFLIITTMVAMELKQARHQVVTDAINYLWKRNVLRVALIVLEVEGNEGVVSLYSASPFVKRNNVCKEIVSFSQLQEIELNNTNLSFTTKIIGYEFEPLDIFPGCSVIANTFSLPPYSVAEDKNLSSDCVSYKSGIEVELVTLMARVYNLTIEISSAPIPTWFQNTNGTSVGMLSDILNYKIDLAFAGGIPPSLFFFRLSLSNSYTSNSVSFYVPDAGIISHSTLVLHSFTDVTWLLLALAFLFITSVYFLMNGIKLNDGLEFVDLSMVALTLGVSTHLTKKLHIRFILLAWSLFSLHLTIMFNTRLFSVFTARPIDPGVKTIHDLSDSKYRLCVPKVFRDFYVETTEGTVRDILEKADYCENIEDTLKEFLENRNFSMLVKEDYMGLLVNEKRDNIHKLKEKFLTYPVVMSVSKHNIIMGYLNKLIYNVTESGLVLKWGSDVRFANTKHFSTEMHDYGSTSALLKNEDFIWLYMLFLSGQAIALVVLAIEISFSKFSKHVL